MCRREGRGVPTAAFAESGLATRADNLTMNDNLSHVKVRDVTASIYSVVLDTIIGQLIASGYADFKRVREDIAISDAFNKVISDLESRGAIQWLSAGRGKSVRRLACDVDDLITHYYELTAASRPTSTGGR